MEIEEFQRLIEKTYLRKDSERGMEGTFLWFAEEVGELARALRSGSREDQQEEFADVLAWLFTLASLSGVEMSEVVSRYRQGCPVCSESPCACREPK